MDKHSFYAKRALDLATQNVLNGGGPFGCVIVKDEEIIAEGVNEVTKNNDVTAHAEMQAVRVACERLKSYQLTGCTIYSSGYPCPMCIGAVYWARPESIFYINSREDGRNAGFDDDFIYIELEKPDDEKKYPLRHIEVDNPLSAFDAWNKNTNKKLY